MKYALQGDEVFGLVRPGVDAHTLGISSVEQILADCGYRAIIADAAICGAADNPSFLNNLAVLERWIRANGITRLGFSYRLDPREGAHTFGRLHHLLCERRLPAPLGGPLRGLYFAGLPEACDRIRREFGDGVGVFDGDETPGETLDRLGVPPSRIPAQLQEETAYDSARLAFARDLLRTEEPITCAPL